MKNNTAKQVKGAMEMTDTNATVVLNDIYGSWPGNPGINKRFRFGVCSVDEHGLNLTINVDDGDMFCMDLSVFQKTGILLALKATKSGVHLAYQFNAMGWNCTTVKCSDPSSLLSTDPMSLILVLRNGRVEFERRHKLPSGFAKALRRVLRENAENGTLMDGGSTRRRMNPHAVVDSPDSACVIDKFMTGMVRMRMCDPDEEAKSKAKAVADGYKEEPTLCPRCGETYMGFPALSRVDDETEVCSECGMEEGMTWFRMAMSGTPQKDIVEVLRKDLERTHASSTPTASPRRFVVSPKS